MNIVIILKALVKFNQISSRYNISVIRKNKMVRRRLEIGEMWPTTRRDVGHTVLELR